MRKPPSNTEAERTILGAILLRPDLLKVCQHEGLRPEHFSLDTHAQIFRTLLKMAAADRPIDLLLLCEEVDTEAAGGFAYLSQMCDGAVPESKHIAERCRIVRRKFQLRRVLQIAEQTDKAARDFGANPEQIIADFTRQLLEVTAQ